MIRANAKELQRPRSTVSSSSIGSSAAPHDPSNGASHPPESPGKVTKVAGKTSPSKPRAGGKDMDGGGNTRRKSRFA